MKPKILRLAVLNLFLLSLASVSVAQPILIEIRDVHVKPGQIAQYEAAIEESVAFRQENDFPFAVRAFQAEPDLYRYVTFLGDWAGREEIDRWFAPFLAGEPSDFVRPLFEAIENQSISYERIRPDLTYNPETAPVDINTAGVMHELRLYPMAHTGRQVADVLERFAAVYVANEVPGSKFVWQQVAGSNGPMFAQYFPSENAASYYVERAAAMESMGSDFQALLQELGPLLRKIENVSWTSRHDLSYVP